MMMDKTIATNSYRISLGGGMQISNLANSKSFPFGNNLLPISPTYIHPCLPSSLCSYQSTLNSVVGVESIPLFHGKHL